MKDTHSCYLEVRAMTNRVFGSYTQVAMLTGTMGYYNAGLGTGHADNTSEVNALLVIEPCTHSYITMFYKLL